MIFAHLNVIKVFIRKENKLCYAIINLVWQASLEELHPCMHLLLGLCGEEHDPSHLPLISVVAVKRGDVQLVPLHLSAKCCITLKNLRLASFKLTPHISGLNPKNVNIIRTLLFQVPYIPTIISNVTQCILYRICFVLRLSNPCYQITNILCFKRLPCLLRKTSAIFLGFVLALIRPFTNSLFSSSNFLACWWL